MTDRKLRVAVLFGGKSAEHEVSLQSARNIIEALDKDKYEVVPIGIDKEGRWLLAERSNYLLNASDPKLISLKASSRAVAVAPESEDPAALRAEVLVERCARAAVAALQR